MHAFVSNLWQRYQWNLSHRPYRTNATTSGCIAVFGDVLAQTKFKQWAGVAPSPPPSEGCALTSSSHHWLVFPLPSSGGVVDLRRSFIFASFGVLFGTPFWLRVYKVIDTVVPRVTIVSALQKGMMSWILANTTTPIFIAYITALDRWLVRSKDRARAIREPSVMQAQSVEAKESASTVDEVWSKIRSDLPVLMSYSICFWSIQWIPMFYVLPPHFRLVYASCLQIVWSGVTSFLLHRPKPAAPWGGAPL